jgi:hypothetical protein
VPGGGEAFERFLQIMGSETSLKLINARKRSNEDNGVALTVTETEFGNMIERDGGCFHGFVLMGVGNVGNNGKRQLYFPTFSARFHGLSRQGVQLMSHFGGLMSISTYDRHQTIFLEGIRAQNRYMHVYVRNPWFALVVWFLSLCMCHSYTSV